MKKDELDGKMSISGDLPNFLERVIKKKTTIGTLDKLCQYFYDQIEKHPFAKYIGTFDHYSHTAGIEGGIVEKTITAAKVVLFCFGKKLLDPKILSVRPRAIGLCETPTHYVISFLEVPNPSLTETMIKWVDNIDV
ncbi:MAG TPA: hypothetical protein ENN22_06230 [bacterium]|nr:hypothetical protein [bacterium]